MRRWLALGALVLTACGMAWTARPPEAGAEVRIAFVLLMLLATGSALFALRVVSPGGTMVIGVAVVLRLLMIPLQPSLSDDGYRYIWDGHVQVSGASPYTFTPRQWIERGGDSPVALETLNSPDYHSVYPPVSQTGFALAVWLARGDPTWAWRIWKVILTLVEVAGILALLRLVAPEAAAVYAWHPLAFFEIAGQGHTEGLALGFLALALVAATRQRPWQGGGWLALAGWAKLWPFVLVLTLRRWRLAVAAGGVAGLLALPYVVGGGGAIDSLSLYAGTFDFYSAPFLIAKSVVWPLAGESSSRIASIGMGVAILSTVSVIATHSNNPLRQGDIEWAGATILILTLLSPTLHPWHLTPALFAVALCGTSRTTAPILWLVSIAPVTYLVYVGLDWTYSLAIVVGWGGAAIAGVVASRDALFATLLRRRGRQKWERLRSFVDREGQLLDYGSAEGYVGFAASEDGHAVRLSDRADTRQVDLPFVLCGDTALPLDDDCVDTTLLVFVLHHASTPEAILSEAVRVSRESVLVWETVPAPWMPISVLERLDGLANRQRPGDEGMPPARLRSVEAWESAFEQLELRVVRLQRWGWLHPQVLWRIEAS